VGRVLFDACSFFDKNCELSVLFLFKIDLNGIVLLFAFILLIQGVSAMKNTNSE
jgi:hypothetical protein